MLADMRNLIMIFGVLVACVGGCGHQQEASLATPQVAGVSQTVPQPTATPIEEAGPNMSLPKKLFLDIHQLGPGNVTAAAVAGAHQKDLAVEKKYGVELKAYWVNEHDGKIYCLAEAPSAEALNSVHREAHGLLAGKIAEVTADNDQWLPTPGKRLFMDVHHFGKGKVNAAAVAGAHQKDLAAQGRHDVKYLNYWFDAETGTVMCLTEAASADAALAVHRDAHGLMPDAIEEVVEGR
jgi:Protein of unknown function (DUF4242)